MNGTRHFDRADGILADIAHRDDYELDDRNEFELRVAAVHAQLATAGALAALIAECKRGVPVVNVTVGPRPTPRPPLDLEHRQASAQ